MVNQSLPIRAIKCSCGTPLAHSNGERLFFPLLYQDALNIPRITLVEVSSRNQRVVLHCGMCQKERIWYPENESYRLKVTATQVIAESMSAAQ